MQNENMIEDDVLLQLLQDAWEDTQTTSIAVEETSEEGRKRLENKKLEEELKGIEQDREERKAYALKSFELIVCYLIAIIILVFLTGLGCLSLSDAVLIALVGTLSTNVLGIFYFVMRYLFSK